MRIVLDGGPLTVETGGIRRYVEELALAMASAFPDDEVHVAADRALLGAERLRDAGIGIHDQRATGWARRWWLFGAPGLCGRLGARVFHGTDFAVPYLHRLPAVLTIHDLSPWRFPEWQPGAGRVRRRTPWLLRLRLADAIVTVSEAVRAELLAQFAIEESRVHAIPLAASERFQPVPDAVTTHDPYFLFAGTLEPRKNLPALLTAANAIYRDTGVRLRIAGRRRHDFAMPLPAAAGGGAKGEWPGADWLGAVSDEELATLYANALAVVYPSSYEGFGLPVLEAMRCGAPVVAGDAPALRELVGDAGILVDGSSPSAIEAALRRVLTREDERARLRRRSRERASEFDWKTTAARTRAIYKEAIARFERKA